MQTYFVYMLASKPYGTLYIGVTNNIIGRVEQHHAGEGSAFTRKHRVHRLVWYEQYSNIREAIQREDDEGMAARLEDEPHRARQPALGGSLSLADRCAAGNSDLSARRNGSRGQAPR